MFKATYFFHSRVSLADLTSSFMRQVKLNVHARYIAWVRCECLGKYRKKDIDKLERIQRSVT